MGNRVIYSDGLWYSCTVAHNTNKIPSDAKIPPNYGGFWAPILLDKPRYVYFRTPYTSTSTSGAKPYKQSGQLINPKTYQIICAGLDGKFGTSDGFPPSGTDANKDHYDNLSNFTPGTMEQAIP